MRSAGDRKNGLSQMKKWECDKWEKWNCEIYVVPGGESERTRPTDEPQSSHWPFRRGRGGGGVVGYCQGVIRGGQGGGKGGRGRGGGVWGMGGGIEG